MDASWAERFKDCPVTQPWPDEDTIRRHQDIKGFFTATGQFADNKSPFPLMPGAVRNRAEFKHMVTGYDAAIAYVDAHVQIVLDELERQGVLDDAILIVSADHGDAFGEHGIYSDHVCADACIHRIPLIIRWPGTTPHGHVSNALLYNVDLSATLLDMVGAPAPELYDGKSFLQNVKGSSPGFGRDCLVWGHALYAVQRAVRTTRHLMVRTYDDYGYPFDPTELYDMVADPWQARNLRDEQPALVAEHDHLLAEWLHEQTACASANGHAIPDPLSLVLQERAEWRSMKR
jgi:arylsulfatase A-like enzyme